ncbi:MAG: heparinase II/III domain-containing protein [Bacteriovorax sp.]
MNKIFLFVVFTIVGCGTNVINKGLLHENHPRLYVHQEDLGRLKTLIAQDEVVKHWYQELEKDSEAILKEPTVTYKLVGPRLLQESRDALRRITTLAGLYLIDGDVRKAERARVELIAAANLKDWNPSHFLDVAEMTHAMAIGYDWLYSYLSEQDKVIIRNAIMAKGLQEGMKAYQLPMWWVSSSTNWNQVCNAGLSIGAMAIAEDEPRLSAQILSHAKSSLPQSMSKYRMDGGDPEGVMYWRYGTSYNIYFLDALKTAFDDKIKIDDSALKDTGYFRIYSLGPTNKIFNFSDAYDYRSTSPQMLWLARRFKNSHFADFERKIKNNSNIFDLLWSLDHRYPKNEEALPLNRLFKSIDVALFRSSWNDDNSQFVGFKGGDNSANHSHLDLGSFVYDLSGERWALDMGPDDYNLPGYFDKKKRRWSYLKLNNLAHNTITIDDENQKITGVAPVIKFKNDLAVVDLTDAYSARAESAKRGIKILRPDQILIQDEIISKNEMPLDVKWNFMTSAHIKREGNAAVLSLNEKTIKAEILSPSGAQFEDVEMVKGIHSLRIHLKDQKKPVKIMVRIGSLEKSGPIEKTALSDW